MSKNRRSGWDTYVVPYKREFAISGRWYSKLGSAAEPRHYTILFLLPFKIVGLTKNGFLQ
jgi:hypothetical protein